MEIVDNLTRMFTDGLDAVNSNKLLSSVLGLFLVLYAALAAPKLPKSVTVWFDNMWFKLGFMFLIAFMATKDLSVAIISAVALLVTLQTLSEQKTTENVIKAVQAKIEKFSEHENNNVEHFGHKVYINSKESSLRQKIADKLNVYNDKGIRNFVLKLLTMLPDYNSNKSTTQNKYEDAYTLFEKNITEYQKKVKGKYFYD